MEDLAGEDAVDADGQVLRPAIEISWRSVMEGPIDAVDLRRS